MQRWRRSLVLALAALLAGALAGLLSLQRDRAVLTARGAGGTQLGVMVAATDARPSRFGGVWFLARPVAIQTSNPGPAASKDGQWLAWQGPPLIVNVPDETQVDSSSTIAPGRHLEVDGHIPIVSR